MALMATILRRSIDDLRKYGPIALALLAVVILDQYKGSSYFTLAPLFAIMAIGIYYGGTVTCAVIGLIISGYSVYSLYDISMIRAFIIILSVVFIIVPFVFLRRVLDNTDALLEKLREIDIQLLGLLVRWHDLSEAEKLQIVRQLQNKIANLLTLTIGWLTLAREKNKVIRDYSDK